MYSHLQVQAWSELAGQQSRVFVFPHGKTHAARISSPSGSHTAFVVTRIGHITQRVHISGSVLQ